MTCFYCKSDTLCSICQVIQKNPLKHERIHKMPKPTERTFVIYDKNTVPRGTLREMYGKYALIGHEGYDAQIRGILHPKIILYVQNGPNFPKHEIREIGELKFDKGLFWSALIPMLHLKSNSDVKMKIIEGEIMKKELC